jgi:hypothetical protein
MTTTDHAMTTGAGSEAGERQATELADRIRALAATDPDLAQELVDQLIENLNRATDGAFQEHLESAAAQPTNHPSAVTSPPGTS